MSDLAIFSKAVGQVSFSDVMNELMINRPDRMIYAINRESRLVIQSLEVVIAMRSDDQILDLIAPWVDGNDDGVRAMLSAIRLCIRQRHPQWPTALPCTSAKAVS